MGWSTPFETSTLKLYTQCMHVLVLNCMDSPIRNSSYAPFSQWLTFPYLLHRHLHSECTTADLAY